MNDMRRIDTTRTSAAKRATLVRRQERQTKMMGARS